MNEHVFRRCGPSGSQQEKNVRTKYSEPRQRRRAGRRANPRMLPKGSIVSRIATAIALVAAAMRGRLGRLRQNGLRRVRIAKNTSTWVASDSTNQPVWNVLRSGKPKFTSREVVTPPPERPEPRTLLVFAAPQPRTG
jgi:hypothetical protein